MKFLISLSLMICASSVFASSDCDSQDPWGMMILSRYKCQNARLEICLTKAKTAKELKTFLKVSSSKSGTNYTLVSRNISETDTFINFASAVLKTIFKLLKASSEAFFILCDQTPRLSKQTSKNVDLESLDRNTWTIAS